MTSLHPWPDCLPAPSQETVRRCPAPFVGRYQWLADTWGIGLADFWAFMRYPDAFYVSGIGFIGKEFEPSRPGHTEAQLPCGHSRETPVGQVPRTDECGVCKLTRQDATCAS